MPLKSGQILGPYEIIRPLGAGGMREVYLARDTRLDRTVAVKVLPEHLSGNAELRERFEREARTVSSLKHPHICALYDVGSQDGIDYLVMEHLEGETLAERLKRGPLPLAQALSRAIEIADALDKAHRNGVVHQDLKPGNVMLLTEGGAKLLDFGLAKVAGPGRGASPVSSLPHRGEVPHRKRSDPRNVSVPWRPSSSKASPSTCFPRLTGQLNKSGSERTWPFFAVSVGV